MESQNFFSKYFGSVLLTAPCSGHAIKFFKHLGLTGTKVLHICEIFSTSTFNMYPVFWCKLYLHQYNKYVIGKEEKNTFLVSLTLQSKRLCKSIWYFKRRLLISFNSCCNSWFSMSLTLQSVEDVQDQYLYYPHITVHLWQEHFPPLLIIFFFMNLFLLWQIFSYLLRDWSFITSFAFGAALAWLNTDGTQSTFSGLSDVYQKKIRKSWD